MDVTALLLTNIPWPMATCYHIFILPSKQHCCHTTPTTPFSHWPISYSSPDVWRNIADEEASAHSFCQLIDAMFTLQRLSPISRRERLIRYGISAARRQRLRPRRRWRSRKYAAMTGAGVSSTPIGLATPLRRLRYSPRLNKEFLSIVIDYIHIEFQHDSIYSTPEQRYSQARCCKPLQRGNGLTAFLQPAMPCRERDLSYFAPPLALKL